MEDKGCVACGTGSGAIFRCDAVLRIPMAEPVSCRAQLCEKCKVSEAIVGLDGKEYGRRDLCPAHRPITLFDIHRSSEPEISAKPFCCGYSS